MRRVAHADLYDESEAIGCLWLSVSHAERRDTLGKQVISQT